MLRTRMIGDVKVSSLVEYFGPTHVPSVVFPDFDRKELEANLDWVAPNHYAPLMDRFIVAPGELILLPDGLGGFVRRNRKAPQAE